MARQAYIPLRNGSQRFFLIKKNSSVRKTAQRQHQIPDHVGMEWNCMLDQARKTG